MPITRMCCSSIDNEKHDLDCPRLQYACPICGQPVRCNPGERKANIYHGECLEKEMKTKKGCKPHKA